MSSPESWKILNSRYVFDSSWLRVREDRVRTANGLVLDDYYVVERRDFSMVVALTAERKVIFIREYKHGAGKVMLQCPAGYLNDGEDPADSAQRELLEETGYTASVAEPLGAYYVSTGMLNTRGHLYLCRDATLQVAREDRQLDLAEDIAIELIDFEEAIRRVATGDLTEDMVTTAALLRAAQVLRSS